MESARWNGREEIRRVIGVTASPVHGCGASSDRAPCSSQFRKSEDCNARYHSASTSRAIAMNGPLGACSVKEQLASHCSYISGSGSWRTVSSRIVRLRSNPIASGVVFRLRRRRRPSDASRAASSWLQTWAGRISGHLEIQSEAIGQGPMIIPVERDQVQLDGLQVSDQQLQRSEPLERRHRLEIAAAAGAGLHLMLLSALVRGQRAEMLVVPFPTVNAVQPLNLPVRGAAAATQPPTAVETTTLRHDGPRAADGAIACLPMQWQLSFDLAAA